MGAPMARRLLAAGHEVTVWNRSRNKALPLAESGASIADSAASAVRDADIVFTMLSDGPAVSEVLEQGGVAASLKPGSLFVDTSSIPPATARRHFQLLSQCGAEALDAPVSGGVVGAEAGSLAIMVGGNQAAFERALPMFQCLGRATYVGPPGSGALAKLANQLIVGITIGAVAEALTLAEGGGANPSAVREAIRGGFAESRILELHGARMLARNFKPGAYCTTQLKDLDSALDAARASGLELPLTERVRQLYLSFIEHGGASLDHSALLLELERRNAIQHSAEEER
jgi:2-hydroxy-3-oxopropionate reductase